jgi:cytoskeletal protein RodZ
MTVAVSEELRCTREAQRLSLADVAHATRIPVERLRLLEEGKFASFGSMAYARSFLRKYARFLGVDVEAAAAALPDPILGGVSDYRHLTQSQGAWVDERKPKMKLAPLRRHPAASPVAKVAAILVLVGVPALLWATHIIGSMSEVPRNASPLVTDQSTIHTVTPLGPVQAAPSLLQTAPSPAISSPVNWGAVNINDVRKAEVIGDEDENLLSSGQRAGATKQALR